MTKKIMKISMSLCLIGLMLLLSACSMQATEAPVETTLPTQQTEGLDDSELPLVTVPQHTEPAAEPSEQTKPPAVTEPTQGTLPPAASEPTEDTETEQPAQTETTAPTEPSEPSWIEDELPLVPV